MALTKIKGQNFRAFIDCQAVAEAVSCQVSIQGNMESVRTKDSENSYEMEAMTSRGFSVQVDSIGATVEELRAIITMFNGDTVLAEWDQTTTATGTQNRECANASFKASGLSRLTDWTITANNRQRINVSRQFTGYGALSIN